MGEHNIVVASPSAGVYGMISASTTAMQLLSSFPSLRFGLLVGIGAGVSTSSHDIRLGDVVVSQPDGKSGGVIQYDLGKVLNGEGLNFERKGFLDAPPELLLKALASLQAQHELEESRIAEFLEDALKRHPQLHTGYRFQGLANDPAFGTAYNHVTDRDQACQPCHRMNHLKRDSNAPATHYGIIACGNTLIKDAHYRNILIQELKTDGNCICFEMEAAGLMNSFPCLVIRGISDYADSPKNDQWQRYASITATAYAKELLYHVPCAEVVRPRSAIDICSGIQSILHDIETSTQQMREAQIQQKRQRQREQEVDQFLQALYVCPYTERKDRNVRHVEGTCQCFTEHPLFHRWNEVPEARLLWVSADPGCGKSTLAKYLIDEELPKIGERNLCYFFFKDDFEDQKTLAAAISATLRQLFIQEPNLLSDEILRTLKRDGNKLVDSFHALWKILTSICNGLVGKDDGFAGNDILCVLDTLDEYQHDEKEQLIAAICDLQKTTAVPSRLKFLVTSRPYNDIQRAFQELKNHLPTIHLNGENEEEIEKSPRKSILLSGIEFNT